MANETDYLTSSEETENKTKSLAFNAAGSSSSCMATNAESEHACVRNGRNGEVVDPDSVLPNGCLKGLHGVCSAAAGESNQHGNNNRSSACDKPSAVAGTEANAFGDCGRESKSDGDDSNVHDASSHRCSQDVDISQLSSTSMDDSGTADLSYIPPSGSGIIPSVPIDVPEPLTRDISDGITSLQVSDAVPSAESDSIPETTRDSNGIEYLVYDSERQMEAIMQLITKDLSEPYSIYTYRYFIHNWPRLCFLAMDKEKCVGAIVCKLDRHKTGARRGYIAMLAVDHEYRKLGIGSNLVVRSIKSMMNPLINGGCDEVVLETEISNSAALHLYEKLGFVRDKRLFRYYLNGVDALRLKLWLR